MIGKSYKYKGLDFTDQVQHDLYASQKYAYLIQNIQKDAVARTDNTLRANFHGGYSSETLVNSRVITIEGKIVGLTKADRQKGWALLCNAIKPEGNPNIQNRGFYTLEYQDDAGNSRQISAKVLNMPEFTNSLDDPVIEFRFDLFSESEKIYGTTVKQQTLARGSMGFITLGTTLPVVGGQFVGSVEVTNDGNWIAPCKIQIVGNTRNARVYNKTNGNTYKIDGNTSNFIIDNRNLSNNPLENLVVTDGGVSIKERRVAGADIHLDPGVNEIIILADNPLFFVIDVNGNIITDIDGNPITIEGVSNTTETITYQDTYIN